MSIVLILYAGLPLQAKESIEEPYEDSTLLEFEGDAQIKEVDMSKQITLDLRNMEAVDALKYLSLRSGMNMVCSKTVTGRVTLQLKDVPIQDILDIILLSNQLAYEKLGKVYYVMTEKEYDARYGKKFADTRKVKIFRLKYAIPEKAFDLLDTLKSKIGRILVDQDSGTVLIIDTAEKIDEMEKTLAALEEKNIISIFDLKYADAKNMEEQLRVLLDDKRVGSVRADERNNQVIVQTLSGRMDDIERIIKGLDKKTKQVLIEAKIIKVKLSDDLEAGLEWEGMFRALGNHGINFIGSHPFKPIYRTGLGYIDSFTDDSTMTVPLAPETNPSAGSKGTYAEKIYFGKSSGKNSYEVLFKFLQTLGDTRLLSNPKLAVVNNQEAKIHVGRREAYITTTTTTGQTTTTTAEEVSFVDVGIQLSVTPTINEDGYITMKIKPEVSSVVSTLITPSNNKIPIVDTSLAETTVMVKDGATIIIGGLRREEEVHTVKRVPFLGSIPLIGAAFTHRTYDNERTELLVMITPHIISGDMLVTGEVEPGQIGTKPYKDYGVFQSDDKEEYGQLQLKSYREY